ncbi:MAG: aminoacyl-tRNA hydrolase [Solobacterium sp.]|jgi:PTH1 family peptidyl-tRNA hydrolase|nr:aminoacyl-tRNA hydrolase [Solobacterium sp.]MCH4221869.1 aminoacyl-tRNA hydrolase [Solobacterium sp.]MCH4265192.1 aminoacyl-tRNA hydrolase [Solobacterium sp.]
MKLIAGLGNPGREYEKTRHNSGFMAIDLLAKKCGTSIDSEKWNALTANVRINGEAVLLMKPLTYMNESGQAVNQAVCFYHLLPEEVLIIHDDMDIEVGSVRIRTKGSSGGQKGMRSILQAMGTEAVARIRIGVGHDRSGDVPDWVLSSVPKSEQELYQTALQDAADAAYAWVSEPIQKVMNQYNIKIEKEN